MPSKTSVLYYVTYLSQENSKPPMRPLKKRVKLKNCTSNTDAIKQFNEFVVNSKKCFSFALWRQMKTTITYPTSLRKTVIIDTHLLTRGSPYANPDATSHPLGALPKKNPS